MADNTAAVQIAGGSGVGYVFTIHVHKVNDESQPLAQTDLKSFVKPTTKWLNTLDENGIRSMRS